VSNGAHARGASWVITLSGWVERAVSAAFVLGLGVLIGYQYMAPDKRVLSVFAALIVAGIAWRLEMIAGIGVMLFALPFPKGTTFGTTNLALILLVLVIWLLRVGQRELPLPRSTTLDVPIAGLVIAYIVSFYNVEAVNSAQAFANFELFLGTLLMFFVLVNSIRTEADLKRIHRFQVLLLVPISLLAFWELGHPGKAIVPGWIDFSGTTGDVFNTRDVRIGGPFHDYELLADFCGLNLLFLSFLCARARTATSRTLYGILIAVTVFILFSTVTRGPIFSLSIAAAYGLWLIRRHVRVVPLTIIGTTTAASVFLANFVVSHYTRSGNLFNRLSGTQFEGFVPDTRAYAWQNSMEHFLIHPLIGWGPMYSSFHGLHIWFWPHDLYLYVANIVGLFGFTFFAWMLWKLFVVTRPTVDTPLAEDYTEAYLLVARVQFAFFLVDQVKIEYLRNATYQYQVWVLFALWVAADRIRRDPARALAR
jgi:hypothetical protein